MKTNFEIDKLRNQICYVSRKKRVAKISRITADYRIAKKRKRENRSFKLRKQQRGIQLYRTLSFQIDYFSCCQIQKKKQKKFQKI